MFFLVYATHYLVEGMIGSSRDSIKTSPFSFDTGAEMIIIRRSTFPDAFEDCIYLNSNPSELNYSNGGPLSFK